MEAGSEKFEPPAGISFANIKVDEINLSESRYEIIESPYQNNTFNRRVNKRKSLKTRDLVIYHRKQCEKQLRILAQVGNAKDLEAFLESCTNVEQVINSHDSRKRTALHFSASRGFREIVQLLLQYGADPNVQDFNGNTPLHLASCSNQTHVIMLLIKYGADIRRLDVFGKNPLHICLGRLNVLQSRSKLAASSTVKSDVADIVTILQEYFTRCNNVLEHSKLVEIGTRLMESQIPDMVSCIFVLLLPAVTNDYMKTGIFMNVGSLYYNK